jgi:hypothetical protein
MADSGSLGGAIFATTERSRVRRHPERAQYDRETVHAILDAALMRRFGCTMTPAPALRQSCPGATASGPVAAPRRAGCCAPSATASRSA